MLCSLSLIGSGHHDVSSLQAFLAIDIQSAHREVANAHVQLVPAGFWPPPSHAHPQGKITGVRKGYVTISLECLPLKGPPHCHLGLALSVCLWRILPIFNPQQCRMVTAFPWTGLEALVNKACLPSFSIWPLVCPGVHTNHSFESSSDSNLSSFFHASVQVCFHLP